MLSLLSLYENLDHYLSKRRLLLTSTGFTNPNLEKAFLKNIGKKPSEVRALFIPTAANDEESRSIVPECFKDLTNAGLLKKNIRTYDFERKMSFEELMNYDAIYFCGGSETHLMSVINKSGFRDVLEKAIESGLFIIGVSAGSMIFSGSVKNSIPIVPNRLEPHCEEDIIKDGPVRSSKVDLNISDDQAVLILGNSIQVIS